MKDISIKQLKKIQGGTAAVIGLGIAAIIAFLAGFIEGYVHPKACGGK